MRGAESKPKTGNTVKRTRDNTRQGDNTHPPHPAIQRDHHANGRGTPRTRRGGQPHSRPSLTMPPTTATAPHHPQWPHPPPRRGGSRQRIPHHTNSTDTHSPPTHHTPSNGTVRDMNCSSRQHCSGMSRARATPPHWAGQQQHAPPPFHTPRRMDTIHSSTHLLSLIHVHTTDDQ